MKRLSLLSEQPSFPALSVNLLPQNNIAPNIAFHNPLLSFLHPILSAFGMIPAITLAGVQNESA
jgi:hypothetical protein